MSDLLKREREDSRRLGDAGESEHDANPRAPTRHAPPHRRAAPKRVPSATTPAFDRRRQEETMRRHAVVALAVLALCGGARAAPEDPPTVAPAPPTAKEEFDGVKAEYDKAMKDFNTAYRAAKTDEERSKIYSDSYPKAEEWAPRFKAIAEKHPTDPAAADCLAWLVQNIRKPDAQAEALDLLVSKHLASPVIANVCQSLQYSQAPNAESFLRAVLAKSADREAQGRACYVLAKMTSSMVDLSGRMKDDAQFAGNLEKWYGKPYVERLRAADPAALAKESEDLFGQVVEKYGDLKYGRSSLGEKAKGDLFEMKNLVVGKTAPEIEGEDQDGKRFKLSDFRGKVVLLDFWGFW
jgi:hypothetical protein